MAIQLHHVPAIGADLYVDTTTGAVFTSIRGAAAICQVFPSTIQRRLEKLNAEKGVALASLNEVAIQTAGGLQGVAQIDESLLLDFIVQYNPAWIEQRLKSKETRRLFTDAALARPRGGFLLGQNKTPLTAR